METKELETATNEELIYALNYCGYDTYYISYRDDIVAEIKKRMIEPCEDCVSRQAVLEITAETGALETQARVKALPSVTQEQKYCNRNICISNEYNGIGCDKCEVTKSQEKILEPCEDAVSRQAVFDAFEEWVNSREDWNEHPVWFARSLVSLPSVTPTQKWIPVSEKLPEESLNSVIGWDAYRERCVFVQYIDGHFQITGIDESFDILAWMPLPKPYKAEMESE